MAPVEFLRRIAALIPPFRFHNIRYHGLFAAAAKDRANACALAPPVDNVDKTVESESEGRSDHPPGGTHATATTIATATSDSAADPDDRDKPYRQRRRMEWARLLRQVFAVDVLRCDCGGERKVIAALTRNHSPEALRRYLEHMGEPPDPPPTAPARAPPQTELAFWHADADPGNTADSGDAVDAMPDWDAHIAD